MGAEDLNLPLRPPRDGPQAGEVRLLFFPVCRHSPLEDLRAQGGARGIGPELTVMKVGIPRVEEPSIPSLDGHRAVTERMAGQRHLQDLRRNARRVVYTGEALPGRAPHLAEGPVRAVGPLHGPVAHAVEEGAGRMGGGVLVGQDVDSRLGGVGDAAEVVVVEVGEHDVAHILGAEAEAPELRDGGHLGLEAQAGGELKDPGHHLPGVGQIGETRSPSR